MFESKIKDYGQAIRSDAFKKKVSEFNPFSSF
jgi:hypothetical protein